jgi:spermidine synthase
MEWLNAESGYFYTVEKQIISCETRFQKLELVDTKEFGRVLILDGITQVAKSNEPAYHEPMVHPALCTHPSPKNVCVIGAGDGGILREVLKHSTVQSVALAELDDGVIAFSKRYLKTVHKGAFSDPRLSIHIEDGRKFIEDNPKAFDVVIMDMTDPFGPSKYLYTKEFYQSVKKSFRNEHGVFSMHTESPVARPRTFSCIQHTLGSVFGRVCPFYTYIQMYGTLWSITVCGSSSNAASVSSKTIDARLAQSKVSDLLFYNGAVHCASQVALPIVSSLLAKPCKILTDKHPDIPDEIDHK